MEVVRPRLSDDDVFYPETDGKPMAESDFQRDALMYLVDVLKLYFKPMDDVYVSGNMLLYYEEGNPRACVAPDVFVVCETEKHRRRVYKTWEAGKAPDVIIEFTSKSTFREDEVTKANLYKRLGVGEYFQYDPTGDYIENRLKGRRMVDGEWKTITGLLVPGMRRALESYELSGLIFCVDYDDEIHVWCNDETRFLRRLEDSEEACNIAERQLEAIERKFENAERQLQDAQRRADENKLEADRERAARLALEVKLREMEARLNSGN